MFSTKNQRNPLISLSRGSPITEKVLGSVEFKWHTWLEEPTIADAIMDRIVHRAYKIALKGESLR